MSQKRTVSRREGERLISAGKVKVNGKVVTNLTTQIDPEKDKVSLKEKPPEIEAILYYKPREISSDKANTEGKTSLPYFPNLKTCTMWEG